MQIRLGGDGRAVADRLLHFAIIPDSTDLAGPVMIKLTVDGRLIAQLECPDPPCYYMQAFLDLDFARSKLTIAAYSADVSIAESTFKIQNPDSGGLVQEGESE